MCLAIFEQYSASVKITWKNPAGCKVSACSTHLLPFVPLPPHAFAVPFREAPAYSKRKRGPSSGNGSGNGQSPSSLSAPRVLLRSNSDNNLTVSQYQQQHGSPGNWAPHRQQHQPLRAPQQGLSQPGSSALHRSLSPQLLQQMPSGSPNGNVVVRTMGRGARSRSPSLSRLGEEARRAVPSQRQPRWVSPARREARLCLKLEIETLFNLLFFFHFTLSILANLKVGVYKKWLINIWLSIFSWLILQPLCWDSATIKRPLLSFLYVHDQTEVYSYGNHMQSKTEDSHQAASYAGI